VTTGLDAPTCRNVVLDRGSVFQTDADTFDLLGHLACNAPVLTRRQRAQRVRRFFTFYAAEAPEIRNDLLENYAADRELPFTLPNVLKAPPISQHQSVGEIVSVFGGPDRLPMLTWVMSLKFLDDLER
jgi:type I restriction enzyme, R subunit